MVKFSRRTNRGRTDCRFWWLPPLPCRSGDLQGWPTYHTPTFVPIWSGTVSKNPTSPKLSVGRRSIFPSPSGLMESLRNLVITLFLQTLMISIWFVGCLDLGFLSIIQSLWILLLICRDSFDFYGFSMSERCIDYRITISKSLYIFQTYMTIRFDISIVPLFWISLLFSDHLNWIFSQQFNLIVCKGF